MTEDKEGNINKKFDIIRMAEILRDFADVIDKYKMSDEEIKFLLREIENIQKYRMNVCFLS